MDGPTDKVTYRVACTEVKKITFRTNGRTDGRNADLNWEIVEQNPGQRFVVTNSL